MISGADNRPVAGLTLGEFKDLFRSELATIAEQRAPFQRLLTQGELAEALNVSSRTIYTLRQKGCPVVMVGDSPRYDLADVRAWLAAGAP